MFDFGYIICAIVLAACMTDLYYHNRKVEKMFPDDDDPRQSEKRRELTISFYGFGFLLVLMIGLAFRGGL